MPRLDFELPKTRSGRPVVLRAKKNDKSI